MNLENSTENYVELPSPEDIKVICDTTNEFFDVDKNNDLIKLNAENCAEIQALDPVLIAVRRIKGKLIAWSIILPVNQETAKLFLEGKITEKAMYASAMKDKNFEALYYLATYVNEENRNRGIGIYLTGNQTSRLKASHSEIRDLIASVWGDDSKKVVQGLARKYQLRLDFVNYKHKNE